MLRIDQSKCVLLTYKENELIALKFINAQKVRIFAGYLLYTFIFIHIIFHIVCSKKKIGLVFKG